MLRISAPALECAKLDEERVSIRIATESDEAFAACKRLIFNEPMVKKQ